MKSYIEAKNNIIFEMLDTATYMYHLINPDDFEYRTYYEMFREIYRFDGDIELDKTDRDYLCGLIKKCDCEKFRENVYLMLHPGADMQNVSDKELSATTLLELTDTQLVQYFGVICLTVTVTEYLDNKNIVLLKYSPYIYQTGWNNFAKVCRGKVIDINSHTILSYPYDKFFNLNENLEYSEQTIREIIHDAKKVIITDKKDGSLIAVSATPDNGIFVNTNGSFENIQIQIAKEYLQKYYPNFWIKLQSGLLDGYTFIFELITPEDKHCIDYGDTEKLYLTGIRNLSTGELESYENMLLFSELYDLDITEEDEFELDTLLQKVKETGCNREGWVIRTINPDDTQFMFKLKYDEYFILHRARSGLNIKKLYNQVYFGDISEKLSNVPVDIRDVMQNEIERFAIEKTQIVEFCDKIARKVLFELDLSYRACLTAEDFKSIHFYICEHYSEFSKLQKYIERVIRGLPIINSLEHINYEMHELYVSMTIAKEG